MLYTRTNSRLRHEEFFCGQLKTPRAGDFKECFNVIYVHKCQANQANEIDTKYDLYSFELSIGLSNNVTIRRLETHEHFA